jgi:hypothetical protein
MKLKLSVLLAAAVVLAVTACNLLNPFTDVTAEVPQMPDSLSGANVSSSRLFGLTDSLGAEYGHFAIVPQVASNYNGWIESSVNDMLASAITGN